ncbi:MAG: hypothetical protein LQ337_006586 [Flavoplaca oasis]|nr:MAG: hypothetical protein LQ337_006586 [Flavoplaca oasis]
MSQYLSSFLIEPVIRHARRFSRQGDDDRPFRPSSNVRGPSNNGAEIPQRDLCVHTDATHSDNSRQMALDPLDLQVTDMATAEPDTDPSVAGPHLHQPFQTSHEESSRAAAPPDNAQSNDQVTSNPAPSVVESSQPTTSSLSGPARSVTYPSPLEPRNSTQSITQYPTDTGPAHARIGDQALPEDDGMASKRRQIVAIHEAHTSETERARLVHDLMNEGRSSLQPNRETPHAPSPLLLAPQDESNRPAFGHDANTIVPPMSLSACPLASADVNNPFNLSGEDLRPTYYQKPVVQPSTTAHDNRSMNRLSQDSIQENRVFGCPHYRRNIKLQCSRCCRWYTCRFCHDEAEDHPLNRPETKNMLCMFCGSAQPASGHCTHCGEPSARYYCVVCKFWDNTPGKSIYHCNDCGICRVGEGLGKDFFHCKVKRAVKDLAFDALLTIDVDL